MFENVFRFLTAMALAMAMWANSSLAADSMAGSEGIQSRTLENGLKIIVWPDQDIPNIAWYHWVKAGARNEHPGITGLSHFFEHMMFNGTSRRAPGEFDRIMEANGGANNAYTSSDVTVYTDWVPSSTLELNFDLESDRFQNLAFVEEVVNSERGVVYSERRSSVDNQSFSKLAEQVNATAFIAHPYQFPVIGWPSDIENWKMEDLQQYFLTYYAPNNTALVIVGAVDPDRVFELAEKYFGPIPAQPAPEPVRTVEPEQKGQRRLEVIDSAQAPLLAVAFHIPQADHPDTPALTLAMDILGQGTSSRLYQRLVDQEQLAVQVFTFKDEGFDPGLAWIFAVLPPDGDVSRTEQVLFQELEKLGTQAAGEAEIEKARNIQLAQFWRKLATIDGKADLLGTYEVFYGDYAKMLNVPGEYAKVSARDVMAVAARVFKRDNSTVGVLVPDVMEQEAGE
jgi:zinc protease